MMAWGFSPTEMVFALPCRFVDNRHSAVAGVGNINFIGDGIDCDRYRGESHCHGPRRVCRTIDDGDRIRATVDDINLVGCRINRHGKWLGAGTNQTLPHQLGSDGHEAQQQEARPSS